MAQEGVLMMQAITTHFVQPRIARGRAALAERFGGDHRAALAYLERKLQAPDTIFGNFIPEATRALRAQRSMMLAFELAMKCELGFEDYRRAVSSAADHKGPLEGANLAIALVLTTRDYALATDPFTINVLSSAAGSKAEFSESATSYYIAAFRIFSSPSTGAQKDATTAQWRSRVLMQQAHDVLSRSPDRQTQGNLGRMMHERADRIAQQDPAGAWMHYLRAATHFKRAGLLHEERLMLAQAIAFIDYSLRSLPDRLGGLRNWLARSDAAAQRLAFEFGPRGRHPSERNLKVLSAALDEMGQLREALNQMEAQDRAITPLAMGIRSKLRMLHRRFSDTTEHPENANDSRKAVAAILSQILEALNAAIPSRFAGLANTRTSIEARLAKLPEPPAAAPAPEALPEPSPAAARQGLVLVDVSSEQERA